MALLSAVAAAVVTLATAPGPQDASSTVDISRYTAAPCTAYPKPLQHRHEAGSPRADGRGCHWRRDLAGGMTHTVDFVRQPLGQYYEQQHVLHRRMDDFAVRHSIDGRSALLEITPDQPPNCRASIAASDSSYVQVGFQVSPDSTATTASACTAATDFARLILDFAPDPGAAPSA
ncbi:DUF3558 family protein [Amycolatopsis sp. NPDC059021]|uniref:DUF3558 family protein n=1 Tax=Amycolatopsis sp. NPDC059021 TaxID=3346704 RepID=UPI00366DD1CF